MDPKKYVDVYLDLVQEAGANYARTGANLSIQRAPEPQYPLVDMSQRQDAYNVIGLLRKILMDKVADDPNGPIAEGGWTGHGYRLGGLALPEDMLMQVHEYMLRNEVTYPRGYMPRWLSGWLTRDYSALDIQRLIWNWDNKYGDTTTVIAIFIGLAHELGA